MIAETSVDVARPRSTVVIADDDADIRRLVAVAAERAGAVVLASVGDGASALTAVRQLQPQLAILDVSMPAMTGLEVCRCIRLEAGTSGVRVILVSAAVHEAAGRAAVDAGADWYLHKPFRVRALADQIAALLSAGLHTS